MYTTLHYKPSTSSDEAMVIFNYEGQTVETQFFEVVSFV